MSEYGWAAFIAENAEQESAAERSVRLARLAGQRDDREAERAEAERRAALEERHELTQLAALQAGMTARSTADVFADAGRQGDEDAAYCQAQRTIQQIDKRRANRQRAAVEQAQRMSEVTGLASRSAPTITGGDDMLAGAKQAHREYVAASRAAWSAATTGTPRARRPFGGEARRSEVTCAECRKVGANPAESFLIHADPRPEPAPAVPSGDEREWLDGRQNAERRTPMIYAGAEVSR